MKKAFFFVLLFALLFPLSSVAEDISPSPSPVPGASPSPVTAESVLDSLDTGALESLFTQSGGSAFKETVLKITRGELVLSADELFRALAESLLSCLSGTLGRLAMLAVPCVLCGAARMLRGGAQHKAVGEIVYAACYLMVAAIMVKDLSGYMTLIKNAVEKMATVMQALFPLLLTLLAAVGSTGAAFFGPAVVASSGTMTAIVSTVTLRCALLSAMLAILSNLSDGMRISRLRELFAKIVNWTLGVCFTVFIGVTALNGMGVSAADGVTLRTAKYAVDNFVPVVGGMFADTMDTLVGCSLLIKNALGLTGLIVLLSVSMTPLMQALAGVLLYRGAAALLEPVGDERLVKCMHEFSESLMLLFVVGLSVCGMFILLTAQLLAVGNMTVGFR